MFDSHVHSSFSLDSEMKAYDACQKTITLGLEGIAFTDHLDFDYPGYDDAFNIDFKNYSIYMDNLKDNYKGKINVLKGIEVGIQPHVIEKSLEVLNKFEFDFVIASVHIIDKKDPYIGEFYNGKSKHEAYSGYLKEILFMIDNFKEYDVLGHMDYITRYGCYDERSLLYKDQSDLIDSILKKLISAGKGMEINTSSYRDKPDIKTAIFDIKILERYRELGGDIITIGSDAHSPEYIGYKFDHFKEMLIKAGFKYSAYFYERKPEFIKL